MLTQRTNVLFSEPDYNMLKELSRKHKKSVGELIRHAIAITYKESKPEKKTNAQLLKQIRTATRGMNTKGMNLKKMVEYGRE